MIDPIQIEIMGKHSSDSMPQLIAEFKEKAVHEGISTKKACQWTLRRKRRAAHKASKFKVTPTWIPKKFEELIISINVIGKGKKKKDPSTYIIFDMNISEGSSNDKLDPLGPSSEKVASFIRIKYGSHLHDWSRWWTRILKIQPYIRLSARHARYK